MLKFALALQELIGRTLMPYEANVLFGSSFEPNLLSL
jgi:hypothetical protein